MPPKIVGDTIQSVIRDRFHGGRVDAPQYVNKVDSRCRVLGELHTAERFAGATG
jgi:hypothetical protein